MKKNIIGLLALFLFATGSFSLYGQTQEALSRFLNKNSLKHAAVGFKVVDLTTGQTLLAHNEHVSLTPASTMKIVTTATALDILGSDYVYSTRLLHDGIVMDSVLIGNLYIEGSGDPTLGSQFTGRDKEEVFKVFLKALRDAGIAKIEGDIIVLDQLFGYDGVSPKWLKEDLGSYYAQGIYGMSIFDNQYRMKLQTAEANTRPVILEIEPQIPHLTFINQLQTLESSVDNSSVFGLPFVNERTLCGTVPCHKSALIIKGDVPDPGYFFADYFKKYMEKGGVVVMGEASTFRLRNELPEKTIELADFQSIDLSQIARIINVRSNNHYAEHVYQLLTSVKEVDIVEYWKEKGLDSSALFAFDGSGISPANAVSAGFLTDILIYMNGKTGIDGAFYKSLPVAGKEGTVTSFLKKTALSGKAHIKSGSITNVQAYSGYVEKGNKRYAFTLIVNNFTGKRAELKRDMEEFLNLLFFNP